MYNDFFDLCSSDLSDEAFLKELDLVLSNLEQD